MQEIIKHLYVGNDDDYIRAKARDFYILSCCKEGEHGHRSILKYETPAAPHNEDYYFVKRGKHLALNLIDSHDPNFISDEAVNEGIKFISEHINDDNVLVHCNQGNSRAPSVIMLYLKSINELPARYREAFKILKTIYYKFDPGMGIESYVKKRFGDMKNAVQS